MKLSYKSFLLSQALLLIYSHVDAQAPQLAGFVFANAIGIDAKADATASGKKLTRNGLDPGMATSGLGLPVGSYQLQVTAPGCESATIPLTIAPGVTPVVVAYLERKFDPQARTIRNFIRLLQFPSEPQNNGYLMKVISVDPEAKFTASAGTRAEALQNFRPAVFDAKSVKITDSAGGIDEAKVSQKGSYYCFAFRRADGRPGTSVALQRIYQW